jgi:hypothetical protein
MKRQIGGHKSGSFAPALRGVLIVFLTVAYVVVGFAGEIFCAEETLTSAEQIEVGDAPAEVNQGSKKPAAMVDHCYTCVPLLIPAPVLVTEPTAEPVPLTFATPTFVLEDHPGLDTPPPKHRT